MPLYLIFLWIVSALVIIGLILQLWKRDMNAWSTTALICGGLFCLLFGLGWNSGSSAILFYSIVLFLFFTTGMIGIVRLIIAPLHKKRSPWNITLMLVILVAMLLLLATTLATIFSGM